MAHGCFARLNWLHSVLLFAILVVSLVGISCIYDGGYGYSYGHGFGDGYNRGDGYGYGFSSLQIFFSEKGMNEYYIFKEKERRWNPKQYT